MAVGVHGQIRRSSAGLLRRIGCRPLVTRFPPTGDHSRDQGESPSFRQVDRSGSVAGHSDNTVTCEDGAPPGTRTPNPLLQASDVQRSAAVGVDAGQTQDRCFLMMACGGGAGLMFRRNHRPNGRLITISGRSRGDQGHVHRPEPDRGTADIPDVLRVPQTIQQDRRPAATDGGGAHGWKIVQRRAGRGDRGGPGMVHEPRGGPQRRGTYWRRRRSPRPA